MTSHWIIRLFIPIIITFSSHYF